MIHKKHVLILLGTAILGIAMSGCGRQKLVDANKVLIWHWMTDRDAAFKELARRYKTETGVTIEFQNYAPSESYQTKVRAAAQTKQTKIISLFSLFIIK